jgi:hypothetical protein
MSKMEPSFCGPVSISVINIGTSHGTQQIIRKSNDYFTEQTYHKAVVNMYTKLA